VVTHTTEANAVGNAAVDTESVGGDDDENVLVYVLCGAGLAVLILAIAGAAFVSCRNLTSEESHAHSDPPRSAHVFRAPIQRVHTMVSPKSPKFSSSQSPKRGRSFPTGTSSIDTFFGQQLPRTASVLKELAEATNAANELVGPRAPGRVTLQASARSTSPVPAPPRIPPGVPGAMSVPGTVGEP
jgi:hypothetical protein